MPDVFLGVGHGVKPDGTFDPGAQAPGRNEYELNWGVVAAAAAALERCGVSFFNEEAAGKGHDPNFAGSTIKANQLGVRLAVEVHHNASGDHLGAGCELLVHPQTSDNTRQLGRRIATLLNQQLGLRIRHHDGLSPRDDLHFLNQTRMPALLPEISFVDNATDRQISARPDYAAKAGEAIAQAICEHLGKPFAPPPSPSPTPAPGPGPGPGVPTATATVSPASRLLAPPRAAAAKLTAYLLARPHGAYPNTDVATIVGQYYQTAAPVGLDPLVAASQMIVETAHLSSFWSQPPRRNLAGIGVTGAPGVGLSFATTQAAVRAQLGRLLAYALKPGTETATQRGLVDEALGVRPLPAALRGVAPTLGGLVGHWAMDPHYATTIARIANEVAR